MDNYTIEILYKTLISITLAFLTIIIPFCGAYWLFKKTSKSNAESSLFQTGREIGEELLNATNIRSPLGGIYYSVIDKHLDKVEERNRDLAIFELAKLLQWGQHGPGGKGNIEPLESANLFVAIVSDRFDSLVPQGVDWSGRGPVFSSFGVEITAENKLFPFGTKLYRQWIDRFGLIYNTIWMFTRSIERLQFIKEFAGSNEFYEEEEIIDWFKKIETKINSINKLHARLITQIQIIDHNINEKHLLLNLLACGVYLVLLSLSGYFFPVYLREVNLLNISSVFLLSVSSIALINLTILRLFVKSGQPSEKYELRRIYLLPLKTRIKELRKSALKYKFSYFENVLSKKNELKLSRRFCVSIQTVINVINNYNKEGLEFKTQVIERLSPIFKKYNTKNNNKGGFSLSLQDIPDDTFDFSGLCDRIISESGNFSITYDEQHSSRTLHQIDLSELEDYKTNALVNELKGLRVAIKKLDFSKNTLKQKKQLEFESNILDQRIDKVLQREPFDLAVWLCRKK